MFPKKYYEGATFELNQHMRSGLVGRHLRDMYTMHWVLARSSGLSCKGATKEALSETHRGLRNKAMWWWQKLILGKMLTPLLDRYWTGS